MSFSKTDASAKGDGTIKKRKKWPTAVKALLIKAWFAGAVYFFVGWGLFLNSRDQLDLVVVLGLVLGAVTDLMVNRLLIFLDNGGDAYKKHMMFFSKKFYFFWVNILYGLLLSALIALTYQGINLAAVRLGNLPQDTVPVGAEPIFYGVLFAVYDALLIAIKNRLMRRQETRKTQA